MMDIDTFRGIVTGTLLVSFLWLLGWAWSRSRRDSFDAAARLPLEEDGSHKDGSHEDGVRP
jgi:cytochrome c oxidase cbb3-type subunit 4